LEATEIYVNAAITIHLTLIVNEICSPLHGALSCNIWICNTS